MIRITVELLPHGDESRKRHLGTAEIVNDATGTAEAGNYTVRLSKWGRPSQTWKSGRVEGFDRARLGAWDLLCWGLLSCGIGERITRATRHAREAA